MRRDEERPTAPVATPRAPGILKGEARAEWVRLTKLLHKLGTVAHLDRTTLAQHCIAWARYVEAETVMATEGVVVKSPNGHYIQSAWLSVSNQAQKQMQSLLSEFGLSPAARARLLGIPKKPEAPKRSGFEGLLANVG